MHHASVSGCKKIACSEWDNYLADCTIINVMYDEFIGYVSPVIEKRVAKRQSCARFSEFFGVQLQKNIFYGKNGIVKMDRSFTKRWKDDLGACFTCAKKIKQFRKRNSFLYLYDCRNKCSLYFKIFVIKM